MFPLKASNNSAFGSITTTVAVAELNELSIADGNTIRVSSPTAQIKPQCVLLVSTRQKPANTSKFITVKPIHAFV